MRNRLVRLACLVFAIFSSMFIFCACGSKSNIIDNSVYFDDTINYSTYTATNKKTASLSQVVMGEGATAFQYTSIDIIGIKSWIGGMYIESVTYTFETSAPTTLELDLTIANVKTKTNFNSTLDYYYYNAQTSLSIGEKGTGSYTFLVNDYIDDLKAPQFLLNIDNLCYQNDDELSIKLLDFKVSGYHEK